jgi:hypothetical protein
MTHSKWGESFLKSGLPLEHLTQVTFRRLGWFCTPEFEYSRLNRENEKAWFELDLIATCPKGNRNTELSLLIECKYHDLSRYWFFLPHDSQGRWCFDDRVLNCAPYQTLRNPRANTFLPLSPMSSGGIVVSEDGTKQDNAVHTALEQLANGFVPYSLSKMFGYNIDFRNVRKPEDELTFKPNVTALIPMIVTNATLYRLKPEVTDIDTIRNASAPSQIAQEVGWTWHYYDVPTQLIDQNSSAVEDHIKKEPEVVYRFPDVEDSLYDLLERPNWVAVVNIKALSGVLKEITDSFLSVETLKVETFLRPRRERKKKTV